MNFGCFAKRDFREEIVLTLTAEQLKSSLRAAITSAVTLSTDTDESAGTGGTGYLIIPPLITLVVEYAVTLQSVVTRLNTESAAHVAVGVPVVDKESPPTDLKQCALFEPCDVVLLPHSTTSSGGNGGGGGDTALVVERIGRIRIVRLSYADAPTDRKSQSQSRPSYSHPSAGG